MRPIIAILLAFLSLLPSCARKETPPDLLIITIDTLRRDALGCYGNPGARTPALDRLAGEGILFADAWTPMPLTLPSHASIFTGVYPAAHGSRHNGLPVSAAVPTLAEKLRAAGYETAAFPASLVLGRDFGLARGFDLYDDEWEGEPVVGGIQEFPERRGDAVTDAFLRWLGARDEGRPFFAWVHLYDPHLPYAPPPPFASAAGGAYPGEVFFTDRQVGRILAALESRGLLGRTIVTVLADHGEGLGDHGELEHGLVLYETTLALSWILRLPGGPRGTVSAGGVATVDLLPTLASLLSIDAPPAAPGRDLLSFKTGAPERDRYAESHYGKISYGWAPLASLRRGEWKLVRGARDELYHLSEDPGENHDLAPREVERVREMAAALESLAAAGPETAEAEIAPEQRAMLEALGYVAPRSGVPVRRGADPRDLFGAHQDLVLGRRALDRGRTEEARTFLRRALEIDSLATDAMESLARIFRDEGDDRGEERLLRRIIEIDPGRARAWNNLGTWNIRTGGDLEEALLCYERATRADSVLAEAWANRANTLAQLGRLREAIDAYDRALTIDSDLAVARYGKALALRRQGDLEGFARELQLTVRSDPDFAAARALLEELRRLTAGTP
ncbi:MAG: sulfatase-like hydrolase/transferase [Candidatus Eisenbacteria bacterium]